MTTRIQKPFNPNWQETSQEAWRKEAIQHFSTHPEAQKYWGRGVTKADKAKYEVVAHIIGAFRGTFAIRMSYTPQDIVEMLKDHSLRCEDCRCYTYPKSKAAQEEMEAYAIRYFEKVQA